MTVSPSSPDQSATLTPQDINDLRDFIRVQVAAGYAPLAVIVEEAVDAFSDSLPADAVRQAATSLADAALAEHLAEQATWPETTDCDRLDAAFAALEAAGIVARQHFTCCGACGATQILDEMDRVAKDGRPVRGYTFFHIQDTEHAVDGDGLFLSYGAPDGNRESAIAIGHEVVAALREQGLEPNWNGRHSYRIGLPIVWRRRR